VLAGTDGWPATETTLQFVPASVAGQQAGVTVTGLAELLDPPHAATSKATNAIARAVRATWVLTVA
jgi:hypothetical protein